MPKTTKNSTPKKVVTKTSKSMNSDLSESASMTTPTQAFTQSFAQNRNLYLLFIIGIIAALLYYFRGVFVVAVVNNRPITRYEVIKSLEAQGGKGALDALISEELLKQEAKKKGIVVSKAEVDERIKSIESDLKKSGQSLDELLKAQNLTRKQVEEQTELQLMLKKILADKIKVTDKEVTDAMAQQKDSKPKEMSDAEFKKQITSSLENQKLSFEAQTYIQGLQSKANIKYLKTY